MTRKPEKAAATLRRMTLEDLPQVEVLDRICFSDPWPAGSFLYELRPDSSSVCLVAETNNKGEQSRVIGVIVVWIILDEAHIGTLAVLPAFRKLGIARRLLSSALLLAFDDGARKALLEVRASNLEALKLYYGLGFEVVGIRPGYYQDNHEDAWLLTLEPIDPQLLEKHQSQ